MRVTFRPPTPADLDALSKSMRPIDAFECKLVLGLEPRDALEACVTDSISASAAIIDGRVVCVFGYSESFLGEEAYPWLLCADGIERHARTMLTCAPRFLGEMGRPGQRLANIVHAHNRSAIRFLRWLGFRFGAEIMVKGEPFLPFERAVEALEAA